MNILGIIGSIFGLATTVTTFTVAVLWAMPFPNIYKTSYTFTFKEWGFSESREKWSY